MAQQFVSASSQYYRFPSQLPGAPYPMTMACWANIATPAGALGVLMGTSTNGGAGRNTMYYDSDVSGGGVGPAVKAASTATAGGAAAVSFSNVVLLANTWMHHACVWDTNSSRLCYTNGTAGILDTNTRDITGADELTLATRWSTTLGAYCDGILADCAVWSASLTAAEVSSLAAGFSPKLIRPQNLVFYAPLSRTVMDVARGAAILGSNAGTVVDNPRLYPGM